MQPPPSPDAVLLDAWRRAEAGIASLAPPSPAPAMPAVDRVLTDALKVEAARAEAKAKAQQALASEQRQRTAQVEAELAAERDSNARLREELLKIKARAQASEAKGTALARALREAQAEAAALKKHRDYWQDSYARAMEARDTAVRAAVALNETLRDAPGYADGASAALLRAQLLAANDRLQAVGVRGTQLAADEAASPLAQRIDALEREVHNLSAAAVSPPIASPSSPPAAAKAKAAAAGSRASSAGVRVAGQRTR